MCGRHAFLTRASSSILNTVNSLFILCPVFLGAILVSNKVYADCIRPGDCDVLWVAAQRSGLPLSFFSQVLPPTDARDIKIGDQIVSDLSINLREQPANLDNRKGVLPKGTLVIVEDVKKIKAKSGFDQVWLKVSVNRSEFVYKPSGGVTVSLPEKPSEVDSGQDASEKPALGRVGQKIVGCYNKLAAGNKVATIDDMHDCSGYWLTPRALVVCSVGAHCPALPDTAEGRAILNNILDRSKLELASPLKLDPALIPRLPSDAVISNCRANMPSEADFLTCTSTAVAKQYAPVVDCFSKFTEGEKLACFSQELKNDTFTKVIGCLGGGRPSPEKVAFCANKEVDEKVSKLRDCIASSSGTSSRACLTDQMPQPIRATADCLASPEGSADPAVCLDNISPDVKKARLIAGCLNSTSVSAQRVSCLSPIIPGNLQKLSDCVGKTDNVEAAICLGGDNSEIRAAHRVYKCISKGRDAGSVLANCTDGILDDKSRQTLACVTRAGTDRTQLASCAAGTVLPADAARIVGCASSSQGPTSFALCAAGPAMNEEWRIAAECAVQSGGNPVSFVGCTGGRLTVRELSKCLTGEIGKDCFGPNNTIIVAYRNAFNDLTKGPGANNEVVVAISKIGEFVGGGPNSVIRNPGQIWGGDNSIFNNPGQIFGGPGSVFNDPGQVTDWKRWRF
nr:hypothetical protein [Methylorubrum zatmanii]